MAIGVFHLLSWSNQKEKKSKSSIFVQVVERYRCLYNHLISDAMKDVAERNWIEASNFFFGSNTSCIFVFCLCITGPTIYTNSW